jgi:thiol-disulfide isomerase/thioredoxin
MRLLALLAVLALPAVAMAADTAGEAQPPWLGVVIEAAKPTGVKIVDIVEGGPGHQGGLRKGDIVLTIDGIKVARPEELTTRVAEKGVGELVGLEVKRGDKQFLVDLPLGARPDKIKSTRDLLLDKPAPDFALDAAVGPNPARLADLKGRVIVLEFWATWCGPCAVTMPKLDEWQQKYGARGLAVVGVSAEELPIIKLHGKRAKLGYTLASDTAGGVFESYRVEAIPTLVIIDSRGVIRHIDVGAGRLDAAERVFQRELNRRWWGYRWQADR